MREASGKKLVSVQAETRATAIRIGNPASWKKAVHVLEATEGACEQVTEVEIAQAKAEIGAEGIGCEPASAVTLAGLKKLVKQGFVKPEESVVLVLTGNLLKDPDFTIDFHRGEMFKGAPDEGASAALNPLRRPPIVLDATLDAVIAYAGERGKVLIESMSPQSKKRPSLRLALPATSANLGPAFDAAALAMDFYIKIDARAAEEFSIAASGRDREICGKLEDHLILNTYREVLQAAGRASHASGASHRERYSHRQRMWLVGRGPTGRHRARGALRPLALD